MVVVKAEEQTVDIAEADSAGEKAEEQTVDAVEADSAVQEAEDTDPLGRLMHTCWSHHHSTAAACHCRSARNTRGTRNCQR